MPFEIVSHKIELENSSLNILMAGEGEALVLTPSWARGADDFTDLMQELAESGYRAIAINPRGVGTSTGCMTGITLHDLAADVAGVIKALNIAPVNVLGHAYGNKTARCLAADYPKLAKRVILLAAGGEVPPDPVAFAALKSAVTENLSDAEWLSAMQKSHFFGAGDPNIWRSGWYPDVA